VGTTDGHTLSSITEPEAVLRCSECGCTWPKTVLKCPNDGADLSKQTAQENVHAVETLPLPKARQGRGESRDELVENGRLDSETRLRIENMDVTYSSPPGPTDSNVPTPAPVARKRAESPRPSPKREIDSSNPPTVVLRRAEGHIELPPGSMVDGYEIDRRLGAGAMGEVYAARHIQLGKRVAIKAISPRLSKDVAAIERFVQEARTLAQMHHPGLVDVLGFGELADGRAYFVMEYLAGRTLFERLARGRLPDDEALEVFDQMARALEAAHRHGVIHRDLKPENTFLVRVANEQRPIVKLLDFGLAKLIVEVHQRAERTQSGVVIGTAMYLSPEQAHGPNVDHRTDIYALGCIGYELFLGRGPFATAKTVAALIAAHVTETPPMPGSISAGIPPQLDLLLFAMLAKDPTYRPTLAQVRAVIASVRSPTPIPATPARPSTHVEERTETGPTTPHRSKTTLVIAGATMLAGIAIGIGTASLGSRSNADKAAASSPPRPADDIGGGVASQATPTSIADAGAFVVDPPHGIEAEAAHPVVSAPRHDAGSLATLVLADAESPVVAVPLIDATAHETEPAEASVIDAAVEPTAPTEIEPPVKPAPVPVKPANVPSPHRTPTTTPPAVSKAKKPAAVDRDPAVYPFTKKPASR
jgi:serine/threonine protein kinase